MPIPGTFCVLECDGMAVFGSLAVVIWHNRQLTVPLVCQKMTCHRLTRAKKDVSQKH